MSVQRIVSFVSILLTILGLYWLWQEVNNPQKMPVQIVEVVSAYQHMSETDLREAILPFVRTSFFGVNVMALRERLLKLPWIADASIQLVWPDKVRIQMSEQQAKARWRDKAVFNKHGELFAPDEASIPKDLPQLLGPEGSEKKVLQVFENMSRMLQGIDARIVQLTLSERFSWSLRLNNGMTVLLGREEPLKRLERFVTIYPQIFATNDVKALRVDMRYPGGMAVLWQTDALEK